LLPTGQKLPWSGVPAVTVLKTYVGCGFTVANGSEVRMVSKEQSVGSAGQSTRRSSSRR
jgi:hypothetical protein